MDDGTKHTTSFMQKLTAQAEMGKHQKHKKIK